MRLLDPGQLWLLAALPVIVAFYLLKIQREDRRVPSTWLWRRALAELRADRPFQRLRQSLLLWLQLLAAALIALAAARPVPPGASRLGGTLVLVLDCSASMQASSGGKPRFEEARELLLAQLAAASSGDRAALILARRRPEVASPLSPDLAAVERALRRTEPFDGEADLAAALRLASALAARGASAAVVAATDDPRAPEHKAAAVRILPVGIAADNAGIVAFEARRRQTQVQAFAAVHNFSSKPRALRLEIDLDGALVESRTLELDPGERGGVTVELPASADGVLRARVDGRDALKADDEAWLVLSEEEPLRALLVSPGNRYLETAWSLEPSVLVRKVTPGRFDPKLLAEVDIAAFDGWSPPEGLPPGNYLLFGTFPAQFGFAPAAVAGSTRAVRISEVEASHPLLRHAPLAGVGASSLRALEVEPWAQVLARAGGAPALLASERGLRRAVATAFQLADSDWPLQVSFPIFLSNATVWLGRGRGGQPPGALRPGDPIPWDPAYGRGPLRVTGPDGLRGELRAGSAFSDTRRVGVYSVAAPGGPRRYAVSLLSSEESRLAHPPGGPTSRRRIGPGGTWSLFSLPAGPGFWRVLAAGCLALLLLEWGVYLRSRWA